VYLVGQEAPQIIYHTDMAAGMLFMVARRLIGNDDDEDENDLEVQ